MTMQVAITIYTPSDPTHTFESKNEETGETQIVTNELPRPQGEAFTISKGERISIGKISVRFDGPGRITFGEITDED